MNDWPEGWSGDDRDRYGRGSASAQPESARVMRQVRRDQGAPGQGAYGRQGPSAPPYGNGVPQQPSYVDGQGHGGGYDSGYNTGQVYGAPGGAVATAAPASRAAAVVRGPRRTGASGSSGPRSS